MGTTVTIEHVIVAVPARDEAATIRSCIESINVARDSLSPSVTSTLVVVADSCRDDTLAIARSAISAERGDLTVEVAANRVGAARRIATAAALAQLEVPLDRVWIANTDADSIVPADWLTLQLALAGTGVVGVAGTVDLDPGTSSPALRDSFALMYLTNSDGSHGHVHGANLGFRADAYHAVAGWSLLATGEDHDLWNRLQRHGSVASTTRLRVSTSARLAGRAPAGFAADLAALSA